MCVCLFIVACAMVFFVLVCDVRCFVVDVGFCLFCLRKCACLLIVVVGFAFVVVCCCVCC